MSGHERPEFVWKDHGRFVEVSPVRTGWLVLWGRYDARGVHRSLLGNRIYLELSGVRRRLADAVLHLTGAPLLAEEALGMFDRASRSAHVPAPPGDLR